MTSKFGSDLFIDRHLGLGDNDERIMLNKLGFNNIDQFINHVIPEDIQPVSYTHLRAHETVLDLVCRLLLEKKNFDVIAVDCDQKSQLVDY